MFWEIPLESLDTVVLTLYRLVWVSAESYGCTLQKNHMSIFFFTRFWTNCRIARPSFSTILVSQGGVSNLRWKSKVWGTGPDAKVATWLMSQRNRPQGSEPCASNACHAGCLTSHMKPEAGRKKAEQKKAGTWLPWAEVMAFEDARKCASAKEELLGSTCAVLWIAELEWRAFTSF